MRLLLAALTSLSMQAGCTVSAVSAGDDPRPNNVCTSDSECGRASCNQGVCQALNGELESLLISASPPSDSNLPHLTFVTSLEDVSTAEGARDITLPGPSHVIGNFSLPKGACYPDFVSDDPKHLIGRADDGETLPVTVTLALTQRLLGLPQQLYFATTLVRNSATGSYKFDVQVPGGDYDVYLVPPPKQQVCPVPPQLYRGYPLVKANADITFQLSGMSRLPLTIFWPKERANLTGWTADMIEPLGGNRISTEEVLVANPADVDSKSLTVKYSAVLTYSTVVQPEASVPTAVPEAASNLLRLRPPAGLVAPSIFLTRSALGLLSEPDARVEINRFTRLPTSVTVEGRMERRYDAAPVSGSVKLTSTEIYGVDSGVFAAYQTVVQVKADGVVHVELPPGRYRVQAVPPSLGVGSALGNNLAALEAIWDVPADTSPQYGKVLELEPIGEVIGQACATARSFCQQFPGAQVQALPSPETILPFDQAFGAGQLASRASTALVDDSGRFVIQADPGRFDISVRAPESFGFGWFVRPGVVVTAGEASQDLGRVVLPKPWLLYGTAGLAPGGDDASSLASAVIRAYAYLDKDLAHTRDPREAVTVVQVAETQADEHGAYRLLLPSRIDAPK